MLKGACQAQLAFAPNGIGARFKLVTNWRLDRSDPLRAMVGTRSNAIRLDRLYGSTTDNSKAGTVRKVWRDHLGIDEMELRILARTLAFGEATDSLDELREYLDILFDNVGLRRIPQTRARSFTTTSSFKGWGRDGSSRCAINRRRHLPTVSRSKSNRSAMTLLGPPSAHELHLCTRAASAEDLAAQ